MSSNFPGSGPGGPQDVKLTDQEQKLVAKLLSDPTYFPLEFRTWLKNYIQDAGIIVTTSQVKGSGSPGTRTGLPAGLIIPCGAVGAVPPDCIVCDGAAYLRAIESNLFAKIGTTWGAGDGSTTFNVPDLRDRSLFGAGAAIGVAQTDGHAFGSRSGWRHRHTLAQGSSNVGPGFKHVPVQSLIADGTDLGGYVGPDGTSLEGPDYAGLVMAITNGKAA